MRKLIKLYSLFILMLLALFSAGCGKKYVRLTLDDNITANVVELDNIKKNTSITISINVPEDKLIDYITINKKRVNLRVSFYTFKIVKNTTINAYFKDKPEKQFYKLTLPTNVSADVSDLNSIEEKTRVTLFIITPEDKVLSRIKLNGTPVKVIGGSYSFLILADTVVEVIYSNFDDYTQATSSEVLEFFLSVNNNFIKAGTIEVNISNQEFFIEGLININDSFGITAFSLDLVLYNDESYDKYLIYSEGFYIYVDKSTYDYQNNLLENIKSVEVFNFDSSVFDLFKNVYLENGLIFEAGEYSIEELVDFFVNHLKGIFLNNLELLASFDFYVNGNYFKVAKTIDKQFLLTLIELIDLFFVIDIDPNLLLTDELGAEVELVFVDYGFLSSNLDFYYDEQINFQASIKYVKTPVVAPFDLAEFDISIATYYTYYIHLDDDLIDEINISVNLIDYFIQTVNKYPLLDQVLSLIVPTKNGLILEGFYLDESYTKKLKLSDLKTDQLHIYIKWIFLN